ncbi:LacI family DNA-binding transcriptional regulator [Streptomyces sp. NPDC127033]|uniref:LacI family DNA-binding transcriptional regulator n=1 Tax=Streptomyces sp. NPDC127033 TaxID=3347110 RepID=UPI00364C99B4
MERTGGGRDRRATMRDVAARAGVSRSLVSLVFRDEPGASPETRDKVLRAADEIGYRLDPTARLLRSSRSRLLGVVLDTRNAFHADLVDGIYASAEEAGYEVSLSALAPTRDEHKAVERLIAYRSEALILLGPESTAEELSELGRRIPVVTVGRGATAETVDSVHIAEADGARQSVDHLVGLGHRAVVHVDGGRASMADERRRGYRQAMRRRGLADEIRVVPGDHDETAGADAARALLAGDTLPTAVIAYNDRCAAGLLDVFLRAGVRVPADVSVVGCDDSSLARLAHISLTTLSQDAERMAELAVQAAVERLDGGRRKPRDVVIGPHLVVRASTAHPRPAG